MKKYRCECRKVKCEVEREDKFKPEYCTCFCTKEAEWQEVKEEEKAEEIAEELPSWCKVGSLVYHLVTKQYCEIVDVDLEQGVRIKTDTCNGWANFLDLQEARLRPFNESELRELVGKAIEGNISKGIYLVVSYNQRYVSVYGCTSGCTYSNKELLNEYTMADGNPCGVYEHLENGEWMK